jgi:L-threonylcarbamoyladenylate synthase
VVLVPRADVESCALDVIASGRIAGVLSLDPPRGFPDGVVVLPPPRDVDDYARVLYARLREADRLGLDVLLVVPPPADGVGAAVVDRLSRAAARRTP